MADDTRERLGAIRRLLEDVVAPSLRRQEARIDELYRLASDLKDRADQNASEIRDLWAAISDLREKVGKHSGRMEGLHGEILAKLERDLALLLADRRDGDLPREPEEPPRLGAGDPD